MPKSCIAAIGPAARASREAVPVGNVAGEPKTERPDVPWYPGDRTDRRLANEPARMVDQSADRFTMRLTLV
jgi:hypothetical protein